MKSEEKQGNVSTIGPRLVQSLIEKNEVYLVDTRDKEAFEQEHIPCAASHPALALKAGDIVEEAAGRKIVFQCQRGITSLKTCDEFNRQTGEHAVSMEGGLEAWKKEGLPLIRKLPLSLERQVMIAAGSFILLSALLAVFVAAPFVWLCAFAGTGLLFAGATGNCMLKKWLMTLPFNRQAR